MNVQGFIEIPGLRRDDAQQHDYVITRYWSLGDPEASGSRRIRTVVRVNSYERQSHVHVDLWDGGEWTRVVHLPGESMESSKISYVVWKRARADDLELCGPALAADTERVLAEAAFVLGAPGHA